MIRPLDFVGIMLGCFGARLLSCVMAKSIKEDGSMIIANLQALKSRHETVEDVGLMSSGLQV